LVYRWGNTLFSAVMVAGKPILENRISKTYGYRKVWREGLEVAMKIKGKVANG